jgi:succinate dehydrogenase hydrophobic anchor subunit
MPDFSPDERLAIEVDRRRRVTAAFRLGSKAAGGIPGPSWLLPLVTGIALAVVIGLFLGIATLAQNASSGATHTPAPVASPSNR